jgi:DNA processing protein
MKNVRDLLRLSTVPLIGHLKIRALVGHFGNPADVFKASPRELIAIEGISKKIASTIAHFETGEEFASDQLKRVNKVGARIITFWDKEYPELLKRIYDPPSFFFALGKFRETDRYSIGIVGTRTPSHYGKQIAETFSKELASRGIVTISGLARGVDTIVHAATLSAGGRTIAVTGSGLDIPYPQENEKLMEKIAQNGVVMSEVPMGGKPDAANFPKRNRLISGLSLGTLIIESAEDGGAMITASTALDQNREVFAVPGNVTEKRSSGPNKLIREGRAKLVTTVDDVLEELEMQLRPILKRGSRPEAPPPELTLFERKLFDVMNTEPIHIDALAEQSGLATSDALVSLLSLEFKGLVKQLPGKMFLRM